jgi:ABC-type uncharacterized transport system auxiliary subunit
MENSMKHALTAALAVSAVMLAACDRPATTSSTTVVKEPKETVVQRDVPTSSTTVVQPAAPAAAPSSNTNVNVDAAKPADANKPETTTESSRSTTRVETPMGSTTRTETTKTTK